MALLTTTPLMESGNGRTKMHYKIAHIKPNGPNNGWTFYVRPDSERK